MLYILLVFCLFVSWLIFSPWAFRVLLLCFSCCKPARKKKVKVFNELCGAEIEKKPGIDISNWNQSTCIGKASAALQKICYMAYIIAVLPWSIHDRNECWWNNCKEWRWWWWFYLVFSSLSSCCLILTRADRGQKISSRIISCQYYWKWYLGGVKKAYQCLTHRKGAAELLSQQTSKNPQGRSIFEMKLPTV